MEATGGSSYPHGMGRPRLVAAVATVLVGLAGCGDDGNDEGRLSATSDTETTTSTTTTTTYADDTGPTPTSTAETTTPPDATPTSASTTISRSGGTATSTSTTGPVNTTGPANTTTTTTAAPGQPQTVTYPKDAGTPDRRVRLTLTLDRTETPAKGVLTVENTSSEEVVAERGGCDFVWGLYRNGTFVGGHEPMACPAYLRYDRLKPGEVRRYEMTFDGLDDREPRRPLPPGSYDAFAGWDVSGGHWYAAPVTVTVR